MRRVDDTWLWSPDRHYWMSTSTTTVLICCPRFGTPCRLLKVYAMCGCAQVHSGEFDGQTPAPCNVQIINMLNRAVLQVQPERSSLATLSSSGEQNSAGGVEATPPALSTVFGDAIKSSHVHPTPPPPPVPAAEVLQGSLTSHGPTWFHHGLHHRGTASASST